MPTAGLPISRSCFANSKTCQSLKDSQSRGSPFGVHWPIRAMSFQLRSQRSRMSLPLCQQHRQRLMFPFFISLHGWKSAVPSRGRRFRLTWPMATLRLFSAFLRWWQKPLPCAMIQTLLHAQQLPSQPPWGSTRWPRSFLKCRLPDSRLMFLGGFMTGDTQRLLCHIARPTR